ncbi:MAG: chromosomal replication initiator protein DnaA [Ignavibacteriaceae bacterium]|nr:chromosomal replication initiator protein DnaA [Ignavibacteriaceae bacterium]
MNKFEADSGIGNVDNPEKAFNDNNGFSASEAKKLWSECLHVIKKRVNERTYSTWFLPVQPLSLSGKVLTLEFPNLFFHEWVDTHYGEVISDTVRGIIGGEARIEYAVSEKQAVFEDDLPPVVIKKPLIPPPAPKKQPEFTTNLNPKYVFDNFIRGEHNQLARAAAMAISNNPGKTSFNPFFVYGGVGLGKTHLIQAIGNAVLQNSPEKRVIYVTSDKFTTDFVDAILGEKTNEFSSFYRSMDILILDDIQFLTGKEKTQDLFFHVFNALHQMNKQIVLSSDRAPKDLKGMDDRLISRFNWGLTADIQAPDLETRIAILMRKAEEMQLEISPETLEHIATHITSNIRELEGTLVKLLANAMLSSSPITIDLVRKTVREISTTKKTNLSIDLITRYVCEYLHIDEKKIRDKTRKQEIVNARQIAMYLSKELTKSDLKTIGLHFGGRDHSTVIHSINTVREDMTKDTLLADTVQSIRQKIETAAF